MTESDSHNNHVPVPNPFLDSRVGNMLFSVETQTTEERTQQYQSEVESIYKDLTAKGKALMLSTELGVRFLTILL